ncbi:unnamed protein product [marine sediment metagenome]|uniref:Uncharacterized protein n=1 Tax=marine sediment metagenome TaxID=412755 RepID=X1B684_9ZZZZ
MLAETLAQHDNPEWQSYNLLILWCRREELNPRPSHYESDRTGNIKHLHDTA